jgi:predicted AAA+ superfamily ATPase
MKVRVVGAVVGANDPMPSPKSVRPRKTGVAGMNVVKRKRKSKLKIQKSHTKVAPTDAALVSLVRILRNRLYLLMRIAVQPRRNSRKPNQIVARKIGAVAMTLKMVVQPSHISPVSLR